ncbi:MAG: response regulator transcription factor [Chloroflexi bacterium]|nr:response regulator transcription factor [Chloroflexota bacterium]
MDATRVLLVDDHPLVREGLRNLLRHEPDIEIVGEAGDGFGALRLVEALKPDIILMDVVMPGMGGIQATKQIKKLNPSSAVVILTAYDDDRYVLGLLEAGAAGYLLKTASAQEVVQSLRAIRAGESVLHPSVVARILSKVARAQAAAATPAGGEGLTARELDVLRLAACGKSNKDIASQLCLSISTVKSHLVSIFAKMGVASRTEAVLQAVRLGWVDMETAQKSPGSDAVPPGNGALAAREHHQETLQADAKGD